jgi:oligopeptide/dipeptide ABC transporter ATP-binding protein
MDLIRRAGRSSRPSWSSGSPAAQHAASELADLKLRGLSILFITHDLSLGYYISDKSVILYRGRVVEMGLTEKIFRAPQHPYTKMLLASVPRLDRRWESTGLELAAPAVEPETGSGCVYYGRCPLADPALGCNSRTPPPIEIDNGHSVSCFAVNQDAEQTGQSVSLHTRESHGCSAP